MKTLKTNKHHGVHAVFKISMHRKTNSHLAGGKNDQIKNPEGSVPVKQQLSSTLSEKSGFLF